MTPAHRAQLVAEVRYGATAHVRATRIVGVGGPAWWFRVRLGARRLLTCDCGGAVKHRPDALTYDDEWGGCSHIIALYKGHVTTDVRQMHVSEEFRLTYNRWAIPQAPHFVRLTKLGEKIFYPRWLALKLA